MKMMMTLKLVKLMIILKLNDENNPEVDDNDDNKEENDNNSYFNENKDIFEKLVNNINKIENQKISSMMILKKILKIKIY